MSTTQLNEGAGGVWTVTAPAGVTIDPVTDANGIATGLTIDIDYTSADLDPVKIEFTGPVTDPNGQPMIPGFYPGLVLDETEIEVTNGLTGPAGGAIDGYRFELHNDSAGTIVPPHDTTGIDPHPDDYAHFHNLSAASLINSDGTTNATLRVTDPNGDPATYGPAGYSSLPAPSFIFATGTIAAGATETLDGIGPGDTFVLHSEDTPGPDGGSFNLQFIPLKLDVTDLKSLGIAAGTVLPNDSSLSGQITPFDPTTSSSFVMPEI